MHQIPTTSELLIWNKCHCDTNIFTLLPSRNLRSWLLVLRNKVCDLSNRDSLLVNLLPQAPLWAPNHVRSDKTPPHSLPGIFVAGTISRRSPGTRQERHSNSRLLRGCFKVKPWAQEGKRKSVWACCVCLKQRILKMHTHLPPPKRGFWKFSHSEGSRYLRLASKIQSHVDFGLEVSNL